MGWGWLGSAGSPGKIHAAPVLVGWLEAQPRRCSTAISGRREGQVRAAASGRAARRGLRLAGGLGWGCGRAITPERAWAEEGELEGEGEKEQLCGAEVPELLPCHGLRPWRTEQRGLGVSAGLSHQSSAAGQQVEPLAGEDVCWGRTVDDDCLGGRWASDRQREAAEPQLRQPEHTRSEDPTGAHPHACPLSLPPSENHFPSTNAPSSSQRRHLQHLEQTVLLPFAQAIYTSKAQGEDSNNLHTASESNKQTHCPGGLPKPFWPAGSWASLKSSCLAKPLQHQPLPFSACAGSLTLPSISNSLCWLRGGVRGWGCLSPGWGDLSVPRESPHSLRDHPIQPVTPHDPDSPTSRLRGLTMERRAPARKNYPPPWLLPPAWSLRAGELSLACV